MDLAIDVGFSAVKARSPDRRVTFSSVVGRPETGGVGYSLAGNGLKIRMDGQGSFTPLGETALARQRQATGRRDGSWALSEEWTMLLCGALGQLTTGNANIRLVTGLPVNDWEYYHEPLKERLFGREFSFQLHGHDPQTVKIEAVKIPPQPIGSLFNAGFDLYGHALKNEFSTEMGAVIDVGGHTTNILVVDALATVSQDSRPLGLLHGLDDVARRLNAAYPLIEFTPHDVAGALQDGRFWNGAEYEGIAPYTDDYLNEFSAAIVRYIRENTPRAGRLHWLLLTGGGINAIGERLRSELIEYAHIHTAADPVWANVEGYLALGRRATRDGAW